MDAWQQILHDSLRKGGGGLQAGQVIPAKAQALLLQRDGRKVAPKIPEVLLSKKMEDNARIELETSMAASSRSMGVMCSKKVKKIENKEIKKYAVSALNIWYNIR